MRDGERRAHPKTFSSWGGHPPILSFFLVIEKPDAVNVQIRFEPVAGFQEAEMHLTLLRVRRS